MAVHREPYASWRERTLRASGERQLEHERRAIHAHGPAVAARDHRDDREPEARSGPVAAARAPVEALEDLLAAVRGRAAALVAHDEPCAISIVAQVDMHRASRRAV